MQKNISLNLLVDNHGNYLFRYAIVKVRDESLAEDLVQETYLAALKSFGSFQGKSTERTWLTSIMNNKIADHYRKYGKEITVEASDIESLDTKSFFKPDGWIVFWTKKFRPARWDMSPENALENKEFYAVLDNCLTELPDKIESVFRFRELDGISSKEVQEAFNLSPSNYWMIMHRARLSLRRCMEVSWFNMENG